METKPDNAHTDTHMYLHISDQHVALCFGSRKIEMDKARDMTVYHIGSQFPKAPVILRYRKCWNDHICFYTIPETLGLK